jgi:hypothetical protein
MTIPATSRAKKACSSGRLTIRGLGVALSVDPAISLPIRNFA